MCLCSPKAGCSQEQGGICHQTPSASRREKEIEELGASDSHLGCTSSRDSQGPQTPPPSLRGVLPGDKLKKIPSPERVGLGIWSQNENSVCELNLNLLSQRRRLGCLVGLGRGDNIVLSTANSCCSCAGSGGPGPCS